MTGPAGMVLRKPQPTDGPAIYRLVCQCPPLDPNSRYAYLLLADHWADTCVVAEDDSGALTGFIAAYTPPQRLDTLFIWQVAVAAAARGQGLAQQMLDAILQRPVCAFVRHVEATVTPDNTASARLFQGFARRRAAPVHMGTGYPASCFGDSGHEEELLWRIGPFNRQAVPESPAAG